MRWLSFILALSATALLIWRLSSPLSMGDVNLPPIGDLVNPFTGFWRNAEPITGPVIVDAAKIPGLKAPVEVLYDENYVPHIFAQNDEDAALAQGFITASQRLFQMDLIARRISGRLSEVIGEKALELDKSTRRRGLTRAAERAHEAWQKSPEGARLLESYTAGVNAWIEQLTPANYPLEYKLMGFKPEAWTSVKCAYVSKSMTENLASYERDLAATNAMTLLGEADYQMLFPSWNPKQQPIVPDLGQWSKPPSTSAAPVASELIGYIPSPWPESAEWSASLIDPAPPLGSNNWAVAGSRTADGHTLLAGDPHLGLTLPSVWFQIQIHTPTRNVYGVSLPGIPGVPIGFNEHVAWSETNVGIDVSDWYKIQWTDAARTTYLVDGAPQKAEICVETYRVKGRQAPVSDTLRYTVWGPVVHDAPSHPLSGYALRWVGHDVPPRNTVEQFWSLNGAKNYTDYQKALDQYDSPAQNFAFATREGDIAIQVQGHLPYRKNGEGRMLRDGSRSDEAWTFIEQENIPRLHNPARGFIFSANQHSTPPSYPWYMPWGDWEQYRGRRIFERLENMKGATVDTMMAMQNDNFSRRAAEALPLMLKLLDRTQIDGAGQALIAQLEGWNHRYERDAVAPTLFEMWYEAAYLGAWDEMDSLRKQDIPVLFPDAWRFIDLLEHDTSNRYFDHRGTPHRETAREIVTQAFSTMMEKAAKETLAGKIAWGKYKKLEIKHITRRIEGFGRFDVEVGGHRSAPNAMMTDHGPSWRMVVDLSPEGVKAYGVYPGGQSGNPGSRFYDNLLDTWAGGQYNELHFLRSPSDLKSEHTRSKQTLQPK